MENKYNDIERLLELKNKGTITEEEFEKEKTSILNDNSNNTTYKENQQTKTPKKKMKVWQIILLIISILLVRLCSIRYWAGSYRKL